MKIHTYPQGDRPYIFIMLCDSRRKLIFTGRVWKENPSLTWEWTIRSLSMMYYESVCEALYIYILDRFPETIAAFPGVER